MADFPIFEVLEEFGEDLEEPRSDKIYFSWNRGVKKVPEPRGTRDREFLVLSLVLSMIYDFFSLQ
jgi:hypothetical protein